VRAGSADTADGRIAYEVRGESAPRRPWLVLVHGVGYDRSGWDPVAAGLLRRFRLLLIDNRGSGASDRPASGYTVQDMARDVIAVLDAEGLEHAHLAGVSLGGMAAMEVAVDHPERVDRLILAGTTPGWPWGYPAPGSSFQILTSLQGGSPDVLLRRHVENALSEATVRDRPDLVERLVEHHASHPADPDALITLATAGARYYGGRRYTRIRADTTVLHGTADRVVDPRNGRLLARGIPAGRLAELTGLGHLFFWENPGAFVETVTSSLLGAVEPGAREAR
jgi:pimeloyl-ACP methyl ester carboxylesterase